jgi:hypothetical protein
LASLGIERLATQAQATRSLDQGNVIGLTASFERGDGSQGTVADVWLRVARGEVLEAHAASLGDALAEFASGADGRPSGVHALGHQLESASRASVTAQVLAPAVSLGEALRAYQAQVPEGLDDPFADRAVATAESEHGATRKARRDGWLAHPGSSGGATGGTSGGLGGPQA